MRGNGFQCVTQTYEIKPLRNSVLKMFGVQCSVYESLEYLTQKKCYDFAWIFILLLLLLVYYHLYFTNIISVMNEVSLILISSL